MTRFALSACECAIPLATDFLVKPQLYKGEKAITAAGFPAVAWFRKGNADKPLVIFAPGGHHMARIAYGGHAGFNPKDFLAYWIGEKGYSFLALSYPIDTPAYEKNTPDFNAQHWGRQIAEVAAAKINENGLSNDIVLIGWSMAGKVVQPAYDAATKAGLNMKAAISFAATPGTPGLISLISNFKMVETGYSDRRNIYAGWLQQLSKNNDDNGGRAIIPEDVFKSEYVGDISVNLEGYGEVYRNKKFEVDLMAQAADYGAFKYDNYPLIVVLENDDPVDARHALTDRANWTLFNANTVMTRYISANKIEPNEIPKPSWERLMSVTRGLGDRLSISVGGNHFFFVGEAGAKKAADAVALGIDNASSVDFELRTILNLQHK